MTRNAAQLDRDFANALRLDPCSYCSGPGGEIDHIEPVSRGGADGWENLSSACRSCNARKNNKSILLALLLRGRPRSVRDHSNRRRTYGLGSLCPRCGGRKSNSAVECLRCRKETRIWRRIEKRANGCWDWTGTKSDGYGIVYFGSRRRRCAHIVVYELIVGPIASGLELDHLCRNRRCVNPQHIEPVPQLKNILRSNGLGAINSRKTSCVRGHPLSGANLILKRRARGTERACRECRRRCSLEYKRRKRLGDVA